MSKGFRTKLFYYYIYLKNLFVFRTYVESLNFDLYFCKINYATYDYSVSYC